MEVLVSESDERDQGKKWKEEEEESILVIQKH